MSDGTTPRPWEILGKCVVSRGDYRICHCGMSDQKSAEADAALIVRAVNSHDDLVKALEAMVEKFPRWHSFSMYENDAHDHTNYAERCELLLERARSALEKAKTWDK